MDQDQGAPLTTMSELRRSEEVESRAVEKPTPVHINRLSQCWIVCQLTYSNSGASLLALLSNGIHSHWTWGENYPEATFTNRPHLNTTPTDGRMINFFDHVNNENPISCFTISTDDSHLLSASGESITIFSIGDAVTCRRFSPPSSKALSIALHPRDNDIVAIGLENSNICIYDVKAEKFKSTLEGHQEKVTGLAFSVALGVLVSSGADGQLCIWSTNNWKKQQSKYLQIPTRQRESTSFGVHVQLPNDQRQFLAVHETLLAIYKAPELECLVQWVSRKSTRKITCATYSCDGQVIFASFQNGTIGVFSAITLTPICWISRTAYISPLSRPDAYPLVIAAHPTKRNQFALGLTGGAGVTIVEPVNRKRQWGSASAWEDR